MELYFYYPLFMDPSMDLRGFQTTYGRYYPVSTLIYLELLCSTAHALKRMTCVQDSPHCMTVDQKNSAKVIVLGIQNI